jgi:N-acetylneuraminic acid mutarotase
MTRLSLFLIYTTLLFSKSIKISHIPPTDSPPSKRQSLAGTYNQVNKTLYIYGGINGSTFLDDMWEFNFDTKKWKEIHSPSVLSPGPRSSPFIQILPEAKSILLFGGINEKGPLSDLWIFNLDNNIVILTQWSPIFTQGSSPVSSAYNAICAYRHNTDDFIASYGGSSYKGTHNRLTILNLNTLKWSEPEYTGTPPNKVDSAIIQYYKGSLYVFSGIESLTYASNEIYKYDIERSHWSLVKTSGAQIPRLYGCFSTVIDGYLYILFGLTESYLLSNDIYRINLDEIEPVWEVAYIDREDDFDESIPRINSFIASIGDKIVMFGGWNVQGVKNDLVIFEPTDLKNLKLKYRYLNKVTEMPTARIGHRMEVYQDNLMVFGGRDKYQNP